MIKITILFVTVFMAAAAGSNDYAAARTLDSAFQIDPYRYPVVNTALRFPTSRFFAENRAAETPDKGLKENARKETNTGSKPEVQAGPGKGGEPGLKPFIPSEKIEVDQAVDFPYDI